MSATLLDLEALRARRFGSARHVYTQRDLVLYALSVGCTAEQDLQHVYEGHAASRPPRNALGLALMPGAEAGPRVVVGARADTGAPVTRPSLASPYSVAPLATYGIVAAHPALQAVPIADFLPGFNAERALHGEQFIELLAPIPAAAELVTKPTLVDVQSKGKNAVIVIRTVTTDTITNRDIAVNEFTLFALGTEPFQTSGPKAARPPGATRAIVLPSRAPDYEASASTSPDQATLYRLNGDWNALHIDQRAAAAAGFPRPILHGLCTLGIAVRLVVKAAAGGDMARVRSIKARFAKPVFPGDTIYVRVWRDAEPGLVFEARAAGAAVVLGAVEASPQSKL